MPVYVYYIRPNYYNARGYYSTQFGLIYYNGYGYNFYYGAYGYYETSPNDAEMMEGLVEAAVGGAVCLLIVGAVIW